MTAPKMDFVSYLLSSPKVDDFDRAGQGHGARRGFGIVPAGYLLDTNVVSETIKPRPDTGVLAFLAGIRPFLVCVSALTN